MEVSRLLLTTILWLASPKQASTGVDARDILKVVSNDIPLVLQNITTGNLYKVDIKNDNGLRTLRVVLPKRIETMRLDIIGANQIA